MDKPAFYGAVRSSLFGGKLAQSAVTTLDLILGLTDGHGIPVTHTAYMMATAFHEVGPGLVPIRENLNYTKAETIRSTWKSRFRNVAAAEPYVRQPRKLANFVYGGRNGNTGPDDGWLYRGGGLPQTTFKDNYAKIRDMTGVDVVGDPDKIVLPDVASAALVEAMRAGIYTGKKLGDYNLPAQYKEARAIINGDVETNGEKIAGYARLFEAALRKAGYASTGPAQPLPAEPAQPVDPAAPKPDPRTIIAAIRNQLEVLEASL